MTDTPDRLRERIPLVTTRYNEPEFHTDWIEVMIFIPDIGAAVEWHMEQERYRDPKLRGTYHHIKLTRKEGRCDDYPH